MILAVYGFVLYILLPFYLVFGLFGFRRQSGRNAYFARLGPGKVLRALPKDALWLHAVSVGEAAATAIMLPFVRSALGNRAIILSCTTASGFEMAKKKLGDDFPVFYAPLDAGIVVRRFFRILKPRALAVAEMEIWPNLFKYAGKNDVPLVIYNARMPDTEWRRYARFKTLFARVLEPVRLIAAQSAEDASRYCDIGAAVDRIQVTGNIKCDFEIPAEAAGAGLSFAPDKPVILLASSHRGEEALLFDATASFGARLIIAPRHTRRARRIAREAKRRGLRARMRSEYARADAVSFEGDVLILDTLGELAAAYQAADIAVIGGSFTKRVGGHNPLEAAAAACPMLFGPYMGNFRESRDALLAGGAAREIENSDALFQAIQTWLDNPGQAKEAGEKAHEALARMRGASKRTALLLANFAREIRSGRDAWSPWNGLP
jgi:3-deoxy-D-manno-octulosonic-acid transferase